MSSSSQHRPIDLPGPLSSLDELIPFAKIKLVAFDLDGTLLKAPTETPGERIQKLHRSAEHLGARITLATGRTYAGARSVLDTLGEAGRPPVVLYNGSVVLHTGANSLIAHRKISIVATKSAISAALRASAEIFIYEFLNNDFAPDAADSVASRELVSYIGAGVPPSREFNGMHVHAGNDRHDYEATAILLLPTNNTLIPELMAELQGIEELSVTSSGGRYIELRPKGSTKAVGMSDLIRALGIRRDEVLAVGDNDNDIELLQWAGISVVVQGASESAYASSMYVTRFGAERGAIEVLDLVRRAKRLGQSKRNSYDR